MTREREGHEGGQVENGVCSTFDDGCRMPILEVRWTVYYICSKLS